MFFQRQNDLVSENFKAGTQIIATADPRAAVLSMEEYQRRDNTNECVLSRVLRISKIGNFSISITCACVFSDHSSHPRTPKPHATSNTGPDATGQAIASFGSASSNQFQQIVQPSETSGLSGWLTVSMWCKRSNCKHKCDLDQNSTPERSRHITRLVGLGQAREPHELGGRRGRGLLGFANGGILWCPNVDTGATREDPSR